MDHRFGRYGALARRRSPCGDASCATVGVITGRLAAVDTGGSVPIDPTAPDAELAASSGDTGDASDRNGDVAGPQTTPAPSADQITVGTHGDAGDAEKPYLF